MIKTKLNTSICIKEYINEKDYKDISCLEKICKVEDSVNLKLELDYKLESDYKLNMYNDEASCEAGLNNINEFMYYVDETLVAYLGISCFGGNIGEINGMTHPKWRRKGIFSKLLKLAMDECRMRKFNKVLLLSDGKSTSGIEFIKAAKGNYDFSEYRMKLFNMISSESINSVNLRKAENSDKMKIKRQDVIFFNDEEETENSSNEGEINSFSNQDEIGINSAYISELNGEVIGKINIEYKDKSAFISGFGILPDFRGKGYGKETLKEALKLIKNRNIKHVELDVSCKNDRALNLYKVCGFQEVSTMNYYRL